MANNNSLHVSGGISFTDALTILFIALKLIGIIEWSWVWVLSPFWIGLILVCSVETIKALMNK